MTYASSEFWKCYGEYLKETEAKHRSMVFNCLGVVEMLLDLGCGQYCSAEDLFMPNCYVGVDLEIPVENPPKAPDVHLLTADYRTEMDKIQKWMEDRMLGQPRTITSLFSSELTASPEVNSRFYRSLFERFPRLERLIVSGFYYSERRRKSRVEEVSGLLSWQSIGDLETELDERRHLMRVPSKLFGPDVVEVWREFIRPS